ncbi:MAG: 50S ribosomal protein L25/general stress protein Ctc [Actinomycetota bacterium]|nr:50S ribosomal protein L25/general stress protein Ctc [Actinomycetota bacterium]
MAEIKIQAEERTEFGKGAARRIRRSEKVPAVLYGHGSAPVHVTLPGHTLYMALKTANALLSIEVGGEKHLVIPKQVQREVLRGFIEHADLLIVKRGEKVTVDVQIHVVGEAVPGSLIQTEVNSVALEVEATHIPGGIDVSIEGLEIGDRISARDLVLPTGSTLVVDEDALILHITAAPTAEQLESELAEAEAEAGIEHEAPESEAPADAEAVEGEAQESTESE